MIIVNEAEYRTTYHVVGHVIPISTARGRWRMPAQAHSASLSAQRRFRLGFKQAAITFSALPWSARLSPAAGVMTGLAAETRIGRAAARTRMVRAAAASGKSTGAGWQAVSALALIGLDRDRYAALWRRVQSESAAPLRALEDAAAAVTAAAVAASAARGREGHRRGLQVGGACVRACVCVCVCVCGCRWVTRGSEGRQAAGGETVTHQRRLCPMKTPLPLPLLLPTLSPSFRSPPSLRPPNLSLSS